MNQNKLNKITKIEIANNGAIGNSMNNAYRKVVNNNLFTMKPFSSGVNGSNGVLSVDSNFE